ncbi:MAG: heavy-metal-associated domain-containing protein [Acidobacteria bacterium]|nr:heavy-metal-associated domain-containing protein [Acidobacteriota bacterium]
MRTKFRRTDHLIVMRVTRILTIAALVLVAGGLRTQAQTQSTGAREAVVTVKGMQCPFCAYGIKKHLAKIPGVRKVEVDLGKNQAIVEFAPDAKPTDEQIQRAVHDAGFTAGKIEWRSTPKGSGGTGGRQ